MVTEKRTVCLILWPFLSVLTAATDPPDEVRKEALHRYTAQRLSHEVRLEYLKHEFGLDIWYVHLDVSS